MPLTFIVAECCDLNGKCVRFILSVESSPSSSCKNEVMMSSAQRLHLPKEVPSSRGDAHLYNEIIGFMSSHSLGFHAGTEHLVSRSLWLYRKLYLY